MPFENLSIVIQAGGESRRMGQDKALVPFLGRPLVQRVIDRLRPLAAEVVVTTNRPEPLAFLGLRMVGDLRPERSSLGGLYTALSAASLPLVGVVACDMPFASPVLIEAQCRLLLAEAWDVVIPQTEEALEPFHAVYRRDTCLPEIEKALAAGEKKMISWFPRVKVKVLSPAEWQRYDPLGNAFINVNTPEELSQAEALALSG